MVSCVFWPIRNRWFIRSFALEPEKYCALRDEWHKTSVVNCRPGSFPAVFRSFCSNVRCKSLLRALHYILFLDIGWQLKVSSCSLIYTHRLVLTKILVLEGDRNVCRYVIVHILGANSDESLIFKRIAPDANRWKWQLVRVITIVWHGTRFSSV